MVPRAFHYFLLIVAGLFFLVFLAWFLSRHGQVDLTTTSTTSTTSSTVFSNTTTTLAKTARKTLYLVIDDVGHNLKSVERFLMFPGPLTFAILPGLAYSHQAAVLIHSRGQALILHQPMEAIGHQNPGPGLITSKMDEESIKRQLKVNLDELEFALGVNNHMGSLGTTQLTVLKPLMKVLTERHLFFFDSKTSSHSVAMTQAREEGVPSVERDIFLDNIDDRESIQKALQEGLGMADKRGYAVLIGHAWSAELAQVLIDVYPQLIDAGYDFDSLVNYFLAGKGARSGAKD